LRQGFEVMVPRGRRETLLPAHGLGDVDGEARHVVFFVHPADGSPMQENWRELVLRELIHRAEDIDADAIIRVDYQNHGAIRIDETRVKLKRVVATGIAVKLSCAA
jgi:Putative heavy-metal-binding